MINRAKDFFLGYSGKCYGCGHRFTNKEVPKWFKMADGSMKKFDKRCFDAMGKPETDNTPRPHVKPKAKAKSKSKSKKAESIWW